MARTAEIEPRWLVSMMCQWALRQLAEHDRSLGYPRKAAGFSEKTTGGYNHSNPMGISVIDFTSLDAALADLQENHPELCATMMMYYKPWVAAAMQADGHPFGTSTYYNRLHRAHKHVASFMDTYTLRSNNRVVAELECVGIK